MYPQKDLENDDQTMPMRMWIHNYDLKRKNLCLACIKNSSQETKQGQEIKSFDKRGKKKSYHLQRKVMIKTTQECQETKNL